MFLQRNQKLKALANNAGLFRPRAFRQLEHSGPDFSLQDAQVYKYAC